MNTTSFLLVVLILGLTMVSDASVRLRRRGAYGMLGIPPLPPNNAPMPPDEWFVQYLDNFDFSNNATWKQRYQVRQDLYKPGGPVFLQVGGEGAAGPHWMVSGAWVDYAEKYNALMFQLEHRYYGKSQPTHDMSVQNLRYLSSEQALADLANFITAMNDKHQLSADTKWVLFGGSYPGSLAAWARAKYPHLVHASMSASGPLIAQLDFPEFMEVVRNSLSTHSEACVTAVDSADRYVNILLRHPLGLRTLAKQFQLCNPLDANNNNDVANFLESLAGNFAEVVQYNKDNRQGLSKMVTIDTLCNIMVNESIGTPVDRYAAVNSLIMKISGEKCLDYTYDKMIQDMRNETWDPDKNGRQWTYQTCTEFGFFQSAENSRKLFGEDFPVKFFMQQCQDIFGEEFTERLLADGISRSNGFYGALDIKATRIVYVHGSIDPWHALGMTKTRVPESPAIYINGTAHCANMYPPAPTDLPDLTRAREKISSLIGFWLTQK